jgi:hypothetical protein
MPFPKKPTGGGERGAPDVGEILERALPGNLRFPQFYLTASVRIQGDVHVESHVHLRARSRARCAPATVR